MNQTIKELLEKYEIDIRKTPFETVESEVGLILYEIETMKYYAFSECDFEKAIKFVARETERIEKIKAIKNLPVEDVK